LNVEIENDSEGIMQDSHWAGGSIGYFPTYALGNIYSGQILLKMQKDISDWRNHITKGNLHGVKQWLTENVYRYGNLYDPADLIKKITGEELNIQPFLSYLNTKYAKLYGF
jgi:carboxypeptidase Taq